MRGDALTLHPTCPPIPPRPIQPPRHVLAAHTQASIAQLSTSRRCRAELVPRSRCRTAAAEPLVPQGFADAFATATAAPLPPPQHLSVLAVGAPWESVAGSQFPRMERQMDAMQVLRPRGTTLQQH